MTQSSDVPAGRLSIAVVGFGAVATGQATNMILARASKVRPKGVVTRQSTDVLAIQNTTVLKGIEFIRQNFMRTDLSAERVVVASDRSRRSLEKAFRVELNLSILDEIIRARINQAKHLLETTDLPVADVAARSGFANLHHFFRVFRHSEPR